VLRRKRCFGQGCTIVAAGNQRAGIGPIRFQVRLERWLRRRSERYKCQATALRKAFEGLIVGWHAVVCVVPAYYGSQPSPLVRDGQLCPYG
jgi:hypothetical protein